MSDDTKTTTLPWCWVIAHPTVPSETLTLVDVATDESALGILCRVVLAREHAEDVRFVVLCATPERGEEYVQMLAEGLMKRVREASERFAAEWGKIAHDSGAPREQFDAWVKSLDL